MPWRGFPKYLAAAGLVWILGILLGLAILNPPSMNFPQKDTPQYPWAWGIFSNNLRVLAGCFLGLITGSAASLATLVLNGIYTGFLWNALTHRASGWKVIGFLVPHGLLEVPGLLLAGAAGMMGGAIARSIFMDDPVELRRYAEILVYIIPLSVILIFIAAFIESWSISRI